MGRQGIWILALLILPMGFSLSFYFGFSSLFFGGTPAQSALQAFSDFRESASPSGRSTIDGLGEITVVNEQGSPVTRWEINAHFKTDDLVRDRTVRFARIVDVSRLLAPGEEMPGPDLMDLIVETRGPDLMRADCALLKGQFASECGLVGYRYSQVSPGSYKLTARLAYAPGYKTGQLDPSIRSMRLYSKVEQLSVPINDPTDFDSVSNAIRQMLRLSMERCAEVRRTFGNCVVRSLDTSLRSDNLSVMASLTWAVEHRDTTLVFQGAKNNTRSPRGTKRVQAKPREEEGTNWLAQLFSGSGETKVEVSNADPNPLPGIGAAAPKPVTASGQVQSNKHVAERYTPYQLSVAKATGAPLPDVAAGVVGAALPAQATQAAVATTASTEDAPKPVATDLAEAPGSGELDLSDPRNATQVTSASAGASAKELDAMRAKARAIFFAD